MGFKKSIYNIEIECDENNELALYNTISTGFGIANKHIRKIYDNISEIDGENIDEETKKAIEIMKKNNFIVDSSLNETGILDVLNKKHRFGRDSIDITIAPTLNCNMACAYCFEYKKDTTMSLTAQEDTIRFVNEYIEGNKVKRLRIYWYGGEPLLAVGAIQKLSKGFLDICNKNNIKYEAAIITNGYLLNNETANILKNECNITHAQITIDGMRDAHNKRRVLKNGGNSFDTIVDNIDYAKDLMKITVRVNVERTNVSDAEELVEYLDKVKGWKNKVRLYISPIVDKGNCNIDSSHCFSSDEFEVISQKFISKICGDDSDLLKKQYPLPSFTECTATALGSFVIDPLGDIYTCWDIVGISERKIGNVSEKMGLNNEYLQWLTLELPEECRVCKFRTLCSGGCPLVRLNNDNKPTCASNYKDSITQKLKLIYMDYKKQKVQV